VQVKTGSSAAALPQHLTAQILQHVLQQQRLSQCAVACKAWAAAAAAATVHVEYSPTAATLTEFEQWVNQHAGQLLTLKVLTSDRFEYDHELLLPLNSLGQLQVLHLQGLMLLNSDDEISAENSSSSSNGRVDPTQQAAAAAAPLPRLQQLHLENVELASIGGLLQLTQSQALVSVRLHSITFAGREKPSSFGGLIYKNTAVTKQLVQGVSRLLQQLPQRLQVFEIPDFPIPGGALINIAAMEVSGYLLCALGGFHRVGSCQAVQSPRAQQLWGSHIQRRSCCEAAGAGYCTPAAAELPQRPLQVR
jgi:hypothetical protein